MKYISDIRSIECLPNSLPMARVILRIAVDRHQFWASTVTILTTVLQLTKAQENWISYRSTAESLKT